MTVNDLKNAVTGLSPEEQQRFRKWFVNFDSDAWDQQIEDDVQAGNLDQLASTSILGNRKRSIQ